MQRLHPEIKNIFCIGRNYRAHAAELGHEIDEVEPLVFCKPTSSILSAGAGEIHLPSWSNDVHHECELVLLLSQDARDVEPEQALAYLGGVAIGLDLTARDVQNHLKNKGLPWLKSKGFPTSACLSEFVALPPERFAQPFSFSLDVNGERRQTGDTRLMIFDFAKQISYLSKIYGLQAGDIIFTGTPEGVAALHSGDRLHLVLDGLLNATFSVA